MRLFIFDAGLREVGGHHDHFALHFHHGMQQRGVDLRIYAHKSADVALKKVVPLTPLFSRSHYDRISTDPFDGLLQDAMGGAKVFTREIASLGPDAPGNNDVVFLPTAGVREGLGLSQWINSSRTKARVAMLFHNTLPWDLAFAAVSEGSLAGALYRKLGRSLAPLMDGAPRRVLVGATNRNLANLLSVPLGVKVRVLPPPVWYEDYPDDANDADSGAEEAPVVSFVGQSRANKGIALIPTLVRALHARRPGVRCVVHLNPNQFGLRKLDMSEYTVLEKEGLIEIVNRWLEEAELADLIRRSSLLVMPYESRAYSQTLSGLFAMAAAYSRPCVVPPATWMSEQIAAGIVSGICAARDDGDAYLDATLLALNELGELQEKATARSGHWRRTQSGDALIEEFMAWANEAA